MVSFRKRITSPILPQRTARICITVFLLAFLHYNNIPPLHNTASTAGSDSKLPFCDPSFSTKSTVCIFDIGLNTGQDTQQYLEKGSNRVLAVEANPHLVSDARVKFASQIAQNRLRILDVGLVGNSTAQNAEPVKLAFYVNNFNRFSSFKQQIGCRGPQGNVLEEGDMTYCTKLEIRTVSCEQLVREYGTPTYMKIDIEGMDKACLQSLAHVSLEQRPKYTSKENVSPNDLHMFTDLGYTKFKIVNQAVLQDGLKGDDEGHSGPWGEDAWDIWIGKQWHSKEQILRKLPLPKKIEIDGKERAGWYDIHASK